MSIVEVLPDVASQLFSNDVLTTNYAISREVEAFLDVIELEMGRLDV